MENVMKQMVRTMWNGQGTGLMFGNTEFREILGVSEEQNRQFEDAVEKIFERMMSEMEERAKAFMQSLGFDPENPDVEAFQVLDSEMMTEYSEMMMEFSSIYEQVAELKINAISEVSESVLFPEQIQSIREMQLAAMGETPFISPGAFEALGLTDDQRKELERIKKEFEPEFEENLDIFVKNMLKLQKTLYGRNPGESQEEAMKRLMAENPEVRQMMEEVQTQSREFSERVRMRMFDVLTDEQWMRLQELIDNPPEHARLFIRMVRESMGLGEHEESETASESEDTETRGMWMPGPDSWRPGMPVPESYRQQRNERRFPSRQ